MLHDPAADLTTLEGEKDSRALGSSRSSRSWSGPLGVLLAVLVITAPLAAGAVHSAVQIVLFPVCVATLFLALRSLANKRRAFTVTPPLALLITIVAFTAVQLVPLPRVLLQILTPEADRMFVEALGDYSFHSISIDPPATAHELAKVIAYLAFFAAASVFCRRSRRAEQMVMMVVAAGTLVTVLGAINAVVADDKVAFVLHRPAFRQ